MFSLFFLVAEPFAGRTGLGREVRVTFAACNCGSGYY